VCSPVDRRRCSRVDEDIVLLELFDVLLDLVEFLFEVLLTTELSNRVHLSVVGLLLELMVKDLPLLFQSSDELVLLFIGHQELLAVALVLLLNLHLTDKVVFIINLVLDFVYVLWDRSIVFLLQVILVVVCIKLRGYRSRLDIEIMCTVINGVSMNGNLPARMFSTAFATIKFLSDTRPWIGFSSFLGTAGFLNSVMRAALVTIRRRLSNGIFELGGNSNASSLHLFKFSGLTTFKFKADVNYHIWRLGLNSTCCLMKATSKED